MSYNDLRSLGWDTNFQSLFEAYAGQRSVPARVASEYQGMYRIYTEQGESFARVSGRYRHSAARREDFPAVGDWVAVDLARPDDQAVIQGLLPRRSQFTRKVAGSVTEAQVVAANVDTVFLVAGLDGDFNPRRMERYLVLAWESGANPVIVANKADLCPDVDAKLAELSAVAMGVPVHMVSCVDSAGLSELERYLSVGSTVALLGSSGVGKSSLVNRMAGQEIRIVGEVRQGDDRGRHTTTNRELIRLPQGALVIDTPGMRELQLWDAGEGFQDAFEDIAELGGRCRYRDCRHEGEPDCAVRAALESGELDAARYGNYLKLQKELAYLARKEDPAEQRAERERWKKINMAFRQMKPR